VSLYIAFLVLYFLIAIALTVVVLLQPSKGEGLGAIGGGAQLFFDKAKGFEKTLEKLTVILGSVFVVAAIILAIII
jgi:preprotein translocase subunit SecG